MTRTVSRNAEGNIVEIRETSGGTTRVYEPRKDEGPLDVASWVRAGTDVIGITEESPGRLTRVETEEDKGSSCYLTTACVGAMGLPDDCLELTTLRGFRDAILLRDPSGRREVADYYRTAPAIVGAINANRNASSIWNRVYGDVRTTVALVRKGSYQKAFEHYKKMTLRLKEAHL